jgi:integrase
MLALEQASVVGRALDACGRKLDGSAASAEYYRRRRRVFYAALKYAVREGRLSANPLDTVTDRDWRPPEVDQAVDPRRVANPAQMRGLLEAIGSIGLSQGPRLVALYGCMYYGMLRPSEAVSLRADNCHLSAEGWVGSYSRRCARPPGASGPMSARYTRLARRRAGQGTLCDGCRSRPSWCSCSASTSSGF